MDRGNEMQQFPRGVLVDHMGRGGGGADTLSWVIFGLLLALLLLVVVSLALDFYYRSQGPKPFVKWLPPGMPPGTFPGGRALGMLGARYARGEISREEYLQIREDLLGSSDDAADAPTEVVPPPEPPPEPRKRKRKSP